MQNNFSNLTRDLLRNFNLGVTLEDKSWTFRDPKWWAIIIIMIILLILSIRAFYYSLSEVWDEAGEGKGGEEKGNRSVSIHNAVFDSNIDVELFINDILFDSFSMESRETKSFDDEFRDGQRVRVNVTNYPILNREFVLNGSDLSFYVWPDEIDLTIDYDTSRYSLAINNMIATNINLQIELNGDFDSKVHLRVNEGISYYHKYSDGDQIRVFNPGNLKQDNNTTIDGYNIMFFVHEDDIRVDEF